MGEMISAHSVVGFHMTDDGFDGSAAPQFAFDVLGEAPFLTRDKDPEAMRWRRVVAAIAPIGDNAFDIRADLFLHVRDHDAKRMAIVWIARQRFHMGDELAAFRAMERRGDGYFHPKFIALVCLALADAFDLRRVRL